MEWQNIRQKQFLTIAERHVTSSLRLRHLYSMVFLAFFQNNPMFAKTSVVTCHHSTTIKQRVLMHGHQGWNVRYGLCHIYMIYVYIWVVYSFCLFCCLFIIVSTQFVALYKPCKPKPSIYDPRTTTPWQRSKDRYLDRSQSNKYAINMQVQTILVSKWIDGTIMKHNHQPRLLENYINLVNLNPLPTTPGQPPPILRPEPKQQICHQHANTDHFGK